MKIAVLGHSMVHVRQQMFFTELARLGHDVLVLSPVRWGDQVSIPEGTQIVIEGKVKGSFNLLPLKVMGDNLYNYRLLDSESIISQFKPDWLYVQSEPGSVMAEVSRSFKSDKKALFTWENIKFNSKAQLVLQGYDLVVCGNPDAERLAAPYSKRTAQMLQVGIDTDHFCARPGVDRDVLVGYVGRMAPEKGLLYLNEAWPLTKYITGISYKEIPWYYSQLQVVVAYSQDVPWWREQAPNYVVIEALSCGCKAVTSDTAAMKYWLDGCPGVVVVEGCEQMIEFHHPSKSKWLKDGIIKAIEIPNKVSGREWVKERFSSPVLAKKLIEELERA